MNSGKIVFRQLFQFLPRLLDALKSNFDGFNDLQARLMNQDKTPKYGNEDDAADANVTWIVETLDRVFGEKENYRGGLYRVGYWTMTNHAGFGMFMGALPSGRKAGENLASGITPVSEMTPHSNLRSR